MFMYGGIEADDLWAFDIDGKEWLPLYDGGSKDKNAPGRLFGTSLSFYKRYLFLFGGHERGGDDRNTLYK